MTLQASGAISLGQVNVEFGLASTSQLNLLHAWVLLLANKSAPIKLSDLYSKTGHFTGAITLSAATTSVGFSGNFFTGAMNQILRNAGNGNCEINFSVGPNWASTIRVTNNTTGVSTTLSKVNSVNWQGSNPANLLRPSTADNFTIRPI
jgi:hypothetical protein